TYKKLSPVRILDTRPDKKIGLGSALKSDVPVQFQAPGAFGTPTNATAVGGNLAVTGQTSGGYVSLSSTPPAPTPATSTVNFPVGDTRANGITIKLSTEGKIYAVFKGLTNATAHLVF